VDGWEKEELQLNRWAMWTVAFLFVAPVYLIAGAADWKTDFGQAVEPLFFEVMAAGVLPVLLVACIVQYAVTFGRMTSKGVPPGDLKVVSDEHSRITNLYGLIFLAGEVPALYAIGANKQSTFLVVTTCLYGLVMLYLLLGEVEALSDPESYVLPAGVKKRRDAWNKKAEKHEALASAFREKAAQQDGGESD
jgi:hypothetical protein